MPFSSRIEPWTTINCRNSGDRRVGIDTPAILGLACGTPVRLPAAVVMATLPSVATIAVRGAERVEQPGTECACDASARYEPTFKLPTYADQDGA